MTNLSCTFLLICLRHTVHKYKCCQWGQPLVQAASQALHRFNALAASSAYPIQGHFGGCSLSQLAEGKRQGTPSHQSVVGLKQGTIHTYGQFKITISKLASFYACLWILGGSRSTQRTFLLKVDCANHRTTQASNQKSCTQIFEDIIIMLLIRRLEKRLFFSDWCRKNKHFRPRTRFCVQISFYSFFASSSSYSYNKS